VFDWWIKKLSIICNKDKFKFVDLLFYYTD
jgi:hypothetical protein